MNIKSKNTSLVILGITAILCSRTWFFFINDPEGPNLLIVAGLATILYFLSYAVYVFVAFKLQGFMKLSVAVGVQILSTIGLYFV